MSDLPRLQYKPDIMLGTPVAVTLSACDWQIFVAWITGFNLQSGDNVPIAFTDIVEQVMRACYTTASRKAAAAKQEERRSQHPVAQFFGLHQTPMVEDASVKDIYLIECEICASKDEYDSIEAANSELTCGHNGARQVVEVKKRRIDET